MFPRIKINKVKYQTELGKISSWRFFKFNNFRLDFPSISLIKIPLIKIESSLFNIKTRDWNPSESRMNEFSVVYFWGEQIIVTL